MVQVPSTATLKKYGLNEAEWRAILESQGGVCDVCKKVPKTGRLCIDHFHAPKWKKLPPEQRKLWVRGLLCWRCNSTFLGRGVTADITRNATVYLLRFERARAAGVGVWALINMPSGTFHQEHHEHEQH